MIRFFPFLFASFFLGTPAPMSAQNPSDSPAAAVAQSASFQSAALGREQPYSIIVPEAHANSPTRFPVLYVLHGAYGSHRDWPEKTTPGRMTALAAKHQVILVFPDGGQFGWYIDSPMDPASQYESATLELVRHVDATYPTLPERESRAIMGLSMGGHGAVSLAFKHPDLFVSASSLSGILRLENHPTSWELPLRLGPYEESSEQWHRHSVLHLVNDAAVAGRIKLLFDCGVDDQAAIADNRELHQRLLAGNVAHQFQEHPGAHSWEYWDEHVTAHVEFHRAAGD
jgi:S-formylglutathione hydrolase FrmB